ncbi:MAG: hypothetical protein JRI25_16510 [Deltaproteobacteria bacterium]|nr:hypothetical protein [Deltaproteobacteria bacterium]
MKAALSMLVVACAACTATPPQISVDVSPVNVGVRSIDPDLDPRHFDLQFTNRGEQTFDFEGPDVSELGEDDAAFMRGFYKPTVVGEDQIAMEVVSNSEAYPTLVVPICGKGVAPGTVDAEPPVCQVPPDDQPDCAE